MIDLLNNILVIKTIISWNIKDIHISKSIIIAQ